MITFSNKDRCIITDYDTGESFPSNENTVGQYTRVDACMGNKIFEGDIICATIYRHFMHLHSDEKVIIQDVVEHIISHAERYCPERVFEAREVLQVINNGAKK